MVAVRGRLGPVRKLSGAVAVTLLLVAGCGRVPESFTAGESPTAAVPSPSSASGPPSGTPSAGASSPATSTAPSASTSPTPSAIEPAPEDSEAPGTTDCEYVPTGTAAKPVRPPAATGVPNSGEVRVRMQMTNGPVTLVLDRNAAPCTVNSFVSLVQQKFYDKTRCHRLVDSRIFILQCGDPTARGTGGPGYTFADELDGTETYEGGVVAMANGGPNTNGSQFFFVYEDSTLPADFTVFGTLDDASRRVIGGMAYEGQDGKDPQGGGRPNNPSEIATASVVR